jgi:hypothetical protein
MKRKRITYADIAAVLGYSPGYVRKLLCHPERPGRVEQFEQAIEEVIRQRERDNPPQRSTAELYALWTRFADDPQAVDKLAAYLDGDRQKAARLVRDFDAHREAASLGYEERGKAGRERRHI